MRGKDSGARHLESPLEPFLPASSNGRTPDFESGNRGSNP